MDKYKTNIGFTFYRNPIAESLKKRLWTNDFFSSHVRAWEKYTAIRGVKRNTTLS